jgi:hypothetical protein
MRRLLSVLILAGIFGAALGSHPVYASSPKIQVDESEHDFGTIKAGEEIAHEFRFTNTGTADLIITDVKTSCGCTAAVTSAKTIAPGEAGSLKVTFKSAGRKGRQNKTATIFSNDPEQPKLAVRMSGSVDPGQQPEIAVAPLSLDIGVVEPGGKSVREITITNRGAADLQIDGLVGRNNVSVLGADPDQARRTLKPNESAKFQVEAAPSMQSGIFQGYLQIRSNSAQRTVTVPVYGYISDRYMLKPEYRAAP